MINLRLAKYTTTCDSCGKQSVYLIVGRCKKYFHFCKDCLIDLGKQIDDATKPDELKEIEDLVKGGFKNDN